jgi:hypothetical protein
MMAGGPKAAGLLMADAAEPSGTSARYSRVAGCQRRRHQLEAFAWMPLMADGENLHNTGPEACTTQRTRIKTDQERTVHTQLAHRRARSAAAPSYIPWRMRQAANGQHVLEMIAMVCIHGLFIAMC